MEPFSFPDTGLNLTFAKLGDENTKRKNEIQMINEDQKCDFCRGIKKYGKMLKWNNLALCMDCIDQALTYDEEHYRKRRNRNISCDVCERECREERSDFYKKYQGKVYICGLPGFACSSCKKKGWSSIAGTGGQPYILHNASGVSKELRRQIVKVETEEYEEVYSKEDEEYRIKHI